MKTDLTVYGGGKSYPVEVEEDTGLFRAYMDDHGWVRADSFKELEAKARKIKTTFELEFSQVSPDGIRHGTVTGFHAANSNLLVKWDDGSTEQLPGYYGNESMPRLNAAETAKAQQLVAARNEAVQALAAFTDARKWVSLKKAAQAAQDKAVNG